MTPQTKIVLSAAISTLSARYYFKLDWKAALIFGAASAVSYLVVSNIPDK